MDRRGQLTIAFLLPLLLSLFALIAGASLSFNHYTKNLRLCRRQVLASQETLNVSIEKLLELNRLAESLRIARKTAKATLVASQLAPPLYPAALAAYKAVIAKQASLRFKQLSIISQGKWQASIKLNSLKKELNLNIKNQHLYTSSPQLAVIASPANSASPSYRRILNFSERQKLTVRWSYPAKRIFPGWIEKILPSHFVFKGHCSATISKRKMKWKTHLSADRFS